MAYIYEGMFLIDNDLVRSGWESAKGVVTGLLEKHGATVHTARRWDERALAYPIKGKRRATYLLTYFEFDGTQMPMLNRDLEITDGVMRYINLRRDEVPASEREAAGKETEADFVVPEPPADDSGSYRPIQDGSDEEDEEGAEGAEKKPEGKSAEDGSAEAKPEGEKSEGEKPEGEKPAGEAPAAEPQAESSQTDSPKTEEAAQ